MKRRAALVAAALLPLAAAAQVRSASPVRTRLVKLFVGLETALFEARQRGDAAALAALLADDFEERSAAAPGRPLPRADWLAAVPAEAATEIELDQVAVHDRGDTAAVSFIARPATGPARFFVDLWVKAGDGWLLKVRYSAGAG